MSWLRTSFYSAEGDHEVTPPQGPNPQALAQWGILHVTLSNLSSWNFFQEDWKLPQGWLSHLCHPRVLCRSGADADLPPSSFLPSSPSVPSFPLSILPSSRPVGKLLNLSEPQWPYLSKGNHNTRRGEGSQD